MTRFRGARNGALGAQLEQLFRRGTSIGSTEGELLERFVAGRDEAAFEALVARHGPMVLGVCRQLLRDPNDVDDAFQATFLVLVRKAGSLRRYDLLGNWLYGVAYRVAVRARALAARRMNRLASGPGDSLTPVRVERDTSLDDATLREQSPWLHQEVSHLPEKYRVPIVLCYFEGLTHDEAALRLGCPLGTVKGRLARAKDLLRRRLTRRGLTISATALASRLAVSEARAAVPASLRLTTVNAARSLAHPVGLSLASTASISLPVSTLVHGAIQTMIAHQVGTVVLTSVLVAGTLATGVFVGAAQLSGGSQGGADPAQLTVSQQPASKRGAMKKSFARSRGKEAPAASNEAREPVSAQLLQQLAAAHDSFDKILSTLNNLDVAEIDRLVRWSTLTLEADLVLSNGQADIVAAYEAHRNRMKKLHEFTQKIPVSDSNQPKKADHARTRLEEAEQLLEHVKQGSGRMGDMAGMMLGDPGGRGGRMGMMGSMQEMMRRGSDIRHSNAAAGQSVPKAEPKPAAPEAASKDAKKGQPSADQAQHGGTARVAGAAKETGSTIRSMGSRGMAGGGMGGGGMSGGGMGGGMAGGMGGGGMGMGMAGTGMMGGMGGGMIDRGMSAETANRQLRVSNARTAAEIAAHETNPRTKALLTKLDEPLAMSFTDSVTLEDVLKYVKQATTSRSFAGIPIYVDPKGLNEAEATLSSTVRLDLDGVPLKTALRLLLKQLGLAYCVRDGILIISSVQGISEELSEAQGEREALEPRKPGEGGFDDGMGGGGRGRGGMGGPGGRGMGGIR